MRELRFSLWQIFLVLLLVSGVVVDALIALHLLLPEWRTPWLLPLLLLTMLDAVITQRVIVQERLALTEQGAIRVVEAALLAAAARVASSLGAGVPLADQAQIWLRDPLAIFGGRFTEYALLVLIVWVLATLLTQAVLNLEVDLPRAGVHSLPNEEAALLEDRALALATFDRYWLICVLLALAGATVTLQQQPLLRALSDWTTALSLLAVLGCVGSGFLLHSQGQLDQLRYGWQIEEVAVAPEVAGRWRRATWLLLGGALLLGLLLAGAVRFAPPPPVVPVLNVLLVILAFLLAIVVAIFGLLMFPVAWLIAWLSQGRTPAPPAFRPLAPPQLEAPVDRPLLPALIFWGCVLLLLLIALLRYVQQRQSLRTMLGRWPGLSRLLRWLDRLWGDLRGWSTLAAATIRRRLQPRHRPPAPRRAPPRGSTAQLRALYRRLVRAAALRGVPHPRSQTAYEFRAALSEALPPADQDVAGLTEVYVAAEYGPAPPEPQDLRRARAHWRRLERLLGRTRRTPRRR